MNVVVEIDQPKPELRRLDITIDGTPWHQSYFNTHSGLSTVVHSEGHTVSVRVAPTPIKGLDDDDV